MFDLSFFDPEGIYSLIATILFLTVIEWKFGIARNYLRNIQTPTSKNLSTSKQYDKFVKILVASMLLIVGFMAVWVTLRVFGLNFKFFLEKNYHYTTRNIFEMIAFILATNLCFTILKTLIFSKKEGLQLLDTAIQAAIIGLLLFLPRYDEVRFIEWFGQTNYFAFLICLTSVIVVLAITKKHVSN